MKFLDDIYYKNAGAPQMSQKSQNFPGLFFSRMRSEGSRFIWGSGGEAVFAESCVCVRNRSQPFACPP